MSLMALFVALIHYFFLPIAVDPKGGEYSKYFKIRFCWNFRGDYYLFTERFSLDYASQLLQTRRVSNR